MKKMILEIIEFLLDNFEVQINKTEEKIDNNIIETTTNISIERR